MLVKITGSIGFRDFTHYQTEKQNLPFFCSILSSNISIANLTTPFNLLRCFPFILYNMALNKIPQRNTYFMLETDRSWGNMDIILEVVFQPSIAHYSSCRILDDNALKINPAFSYSSYTLPEQCVSETVNAMHTCQIM